MAPTPVGVKPTRPFQGSRTFHMPFPTVTESMKARCEERNVHVWDLAYAKSAGSCVVCGISEEDAERRGAPQFRFQHEGS